VLADYSDRSGRATWLLAEVLAQGLERTLIATVASPTLLDRLLAGGVKTGDPFDAEVGGPVGGEAEPSAGVPVRVTGTVQAIVAGTTGRGAGTWLSVAFGRGNVLVLSPYLVQIMEPSELWDLGLKPENFDVVAIKSRVHFRRGFDDSGYARTILLVEPPEPFVGTVHLDALPYRHLRPSDFYPYGDPAFDAG
jgi:microcystin degradation protein MlrC